MCGNLQGPNSLSGKMSFLWYGCVISGEELVMYRFARIICITLLVNVFCTANISCRLWNVYLWVCIGCSAPLLTARLNIKKRVSLVPAVINDTCEHEQHLNQWISERLIRELIKLYRSTIVIHLDYIWSYQDHAWKCLSVAHFLVILDIIKYMQNDNIVCCISYCAHFLFY